MYVLSLLCKEEISYLKSADNIAKFLQGTPCGFLLDQLINKIDIKSYFNRILKDIIENIEIKCSERKMTFVIEEINKQIADRRENLKKNNIKGKNGQKAEVTDVYRNIPTEKTEININEILCEKTKNFDEKKKSKIICRTQT